MKRRFARRRLPLDAIGRALGDVVDALVGEAVDEASRENSPLRRSSEAKPLAPADLTRQALATAFRVAYAIVERSETGSQAAFDDLPFPCLESAAPELASQAPASDARTLAVERLTQVLGRLSPLELDQDVLGEALARLSTTPFARHPATRDQEQERARRAAGSFFTPPQIVERLLDATLDPLLDEISRGKPAAERETALLDLAIADPACGSGRFLLAAADRIAATLLQARIDEGNAASSLDAARADVIERCIYGADVDPLAIEALRFRLRRAARRAGRTLPHLVERTICGDSLCDVDWNGLLRDRTGDAAGFDLVVGNPPWTSFSGRHRGEANAEAVAELVDRYPEIGRWPALHSAMLALSAKIVRDGGRVGLVLPLRMADLDAYADLRAALATRMQLERPVLDSGESAFADVVQPAGLFLFRAVAGKSPGKRDPWPIDRRGGSPPSQKLRTSLDPVDDLLAEMERLPKFPPGTFGDPGVHSGNVAAKLIVEANEVGTSPLREGRDVLPFLCLPPRRRVRVDLVLEPGQYRRVGPLARYLDTPILLRQTADRPIAARHAERTYFRNSVLACRGVGGVSDLTLVAFLNSALYALLHRLFSGDASQKSFPQVKVRALQNLPLPPVIDDSSAGSRLAEEIERQATFAETAASGGRPPDAELVEALERLILRSFGASEDLAPLLLERAGKTMSPRLVQLK
ncbi:MAG TPA: DNA methyltransferase [Pirellulaceae bacterium]|nr:DNA methyltransferase [Pirellulaceae bacterium]